MDHDFIINVGNIACVVSLNFFQWWNCSFVLNLLLLDHKFLNLLQKLFYDGQNKN